LQEKSLLVEKEEFDSHGDLIRIVSEALHHGVEYVL
jgi:hypothetical protein